MNTLCTWLILSMATPAYAQVVDPVASEVPDIRGVKGRLAPASTGMGWAPLLGGGLALGTLGATGLWWSRRRSPLTPRQKLAADLQSARAEQDVAARADGLIAAIRGFVLRTTGIDADTLTTSELAEALQSLVPEHCIDGLRDLFAECDAARFAGMPLAPASELPWLDDFVESLSTPTQLSAAR